MFPSYSSTSHSPDFSPKHSISTFDGLGRRRRYHPSEEDSFTDRFSPLSQSTSPISSPAVSSPPPRPTVSSLPSRNPYYGHSEVSRIDRFFPDSPSNPTLSRYSRRSSSPPTSSSSPPPSTSPLLSPTGLSDSDFRHSPRVRIVGHCPDAYFRSRESQYDDSPYASHQMAEDDLRPKLPSFRSLFGDSEVQYRPAMHSRRKWESSHAYSSSSSPSISPQLDSASLAPLKLPLSAKRNPRDCSRVDASSITEAHRSSRTRASSAVARCGSHGYNDHIHDGSRRGIGTDITVRSSYSTSLNLPLQEVNEPASTGTHYSQLSHQTPPRQRSPYNRDSVPQTPEDGTKFLSPIKPSPYPRRTYFLESSERGRWNADSKRGRRNRDSADVSCGLHKLAEIAEMARSELPAGKLQATKDIPGEEVVIPSSPSIYPSSLPPSSPPVSEAELSPMVHVVDLPTSPLTDVLNVTAASRKSGCTGLEINESLKSAAEPTFLPPQDVSEVVLAHQDDGHVPTAFLKDSVNDTAMEAVDISCTSSSRGTSLRSKPSVHEAQKDAKALILTAAVILDKSLASDGRSDELRLNATSTPDAGPEVDKFQSSASSQSETVDGYKAATVVDGLEELDTIASLSLWTNFSAIPPTSDEDRVAVDALTLPVVHQRSILEVPSQPTLSTTSSEQPLYQPRTDSSSLSTEKPAIPSPTASTSTAKPFKAKSKPSSTASPIASSAPRVTVTVVKRMKPVGSNHSGVAGPAPKKPVADKGKEKEVLKTTTSAVVNSRSSNQKRTRGDKEASQSRKKLKPAVEEEQSFVKTASSASSSELRATAISSSCSSSTSSSSSSSSSPTKASSTSLAKRKAEELSPTSSLTPLPQSPSASESTSPAISTVDLPNPSKRRKVMVLELPISPSRKPVSEPADHRSDFDGIEAMSTYGDSSWADALAAAYGRSTPCEEDLGLSKATPKLTKNDSLHAGMSRVESSSDEDDEASDAEERFDKKHKTKSPLSLTKRMVIESDSEESDSEAEQRVARSPTTRRTAQSATRRAAKLQVTRRTVIESDGDDEEEEQDENENVKALSRKSSKLSGLSTSSESDVESELTSEDEESTSGSDDEPTKASTTKYRANNTTSLYFAPLDLELIGVIIETMTLSRASSHLASALYRTVCETRSGLFANFAKNYSSHFDAVREKVRSQGLTGAGAEGGPDPSSRRVRSRRGAFTNQEGGVAGMSEVEIMWISEFERVMEESAAKCGVFGMVKSSAKDSRDLPLPFSTRYFYVPDCDPDAERAEVIKLTMPGAGKRSETMKYKTYYWKPVK